MVLGDGSDLDADGLRRQLSERGFSDTLDGLLGPELYVHAGFARPDSPSKMARLGFEQVVRQLTASSRRAELEEAQRVYVSDPTDEKLGAV